MEAAAPPLPADTWEVLPSDIHILVLDLQAQAVIFRTENTTNSEFQWCWGIGVYRIPPHRVSPWRAAEPLCMNPAR
jgi:hypothetical protein